MATVRRFSDFRLDASTLRELPSGAIAVQGQITHPGVFRYRNADGSPRYEYRPDSTVFAADAMASFEDQAVTIDHPKDARGVPRKVSPETWQTDSVGHLRNVRREANNVVADLVVHRADAIGAIKSGALKELSCGYDVAMDEKAGVAPNGQKYDAVQTAIRGNHLALLPTGRARGGSDCMLRVDGDEDPYPAGDRPEESPAVEAGHMDGSACPFCGKQLSRTVPGARGPSPEPENAGKVAVREPGRADSTLQGNESPMPLTAEHIKDIARADAAEQRVRDLEAQLVDGERLDALVVERTALVAAAGEAGVAVKGKDASGKDVAFSNTDIKRAIVAKRSPTLAARADSLTPAEVDIAYAAVLDQPTPAVVASQLRLQATVAGPPGVRADASTPEVHGVDPKAPNKVAASSYANPSGAIASR